MSSMDADVTLAEFEVLERASSEEVDVELINGRIYVVPAPDGQHDAYAVRIGVQIQSHHPNLHLFHERGLKIPAYREGRARVDGAVATLDYLEDQPSWADPAGVVMVVEITSGRDRDADVDRFEKRDAYAQASIPTYLLVDRHRAEVTVYWEPADGKYVHTATAQFGAPLTLPAPLDFELDTSKFRR